MGAILLINFSSKKNSCNIYYRILLKHKKKIAEKNITHKFILRDNHFCVCIFSLFFFLYSS